MMAHNRRMMLLATASPNSTASLTSKDTCSSEAAGSITYQAKSSENKDPDDRVENRFQAGRQAALSAPRSLSNRAATSLAYSSRLSSSLGALSSSY